MAEENVKGNPPVSTHRYGQIKVDVWKNKKQTDSGKEFDELSVSFTKSYKDENGNWKNTNNLNRNELQKAIMALQDAQRFVFSIKLENNGD